LKPDVTAASVISQLYEKTLLTTHIDVEMRCMVDGAPRVMNIKRLIDAFISYRCQVVSLRSARRVRRMDTPEEHLRNLPKSGADVVRVVKEELLALRGVYETKRRTDIVAV
jgi:DNA gyrase subunit A